MDQQEDICISRADGTELRKLTDDIYKDRGARWSPDGKYIYFYSDRTGRYEFWRIKPDGSDLRQVTNGPVFVANPAWLSPDGSKMALFDQTGTYILDISGKLPSKKMERLPPFDVPGQSLVLRGWSPDGNKLTALASTETAYVGIYVYEFDKKAYEKIADIQMPTGPGGINWLQDNRRFLFRDKDQLRIIDCITKESIVIAPAEPGQSQFRLSTDNRWLYYTQATEESDIWTLPERR